ncbi:unnamed protein product [Caenorhabditis angaria]|uniref:Uncharacterized protein n=1 Tax=Caenorhabditis angaria TaxID=860376 RepID=A0A9P1IU13_9PELO|nr:unnamed protein product [Caenorhabditis angaria]
MFTIITSESFRSDDSEWKECSLEEKINSLEYLSNNYEKYLQKADDLKSAIKYNRKTHEIESQQMQRKLRHIKQDFGSIQKDMSKIADERLTQVKKALAPYLKDSVETSENPQHIKSQLIELLSKISGIEQIIKKDAEISRNVQNDHEILGVLEAKQKDAIERFEGVSRVQNLAYDIPQDDQFYNLAIAPALLLALGSSKDVSKYYQQNLKSIQQRLCAFVAQIRFNSQQVFGTPQIQSNKLSNGEISVESLVEITEHPVDSLTSFSK